LRGWIDLIGWLVLAIAAVAFILYKWQVSPA
jgi:hypothetical protein